MTNEEAVKVLQRVLNEIEFDDINDRIDFVIDISDKFRKELNEYTAN